MIYVVSNTIKPPDNVKLLSIEESIKMISSWPVVQFDTETTGLDPHINKLTSLQFGYKDYASDTTTAIVVDCNSIQPELYKEVIESSFLIGHNIKFDIEFLFNHNIIPMKVYDTMICEQTLYLGYPAGTVKFNLADVLLRNTGIEIDKSFQSQIALKGLTTEGIIYAAHDVMYLQDIRKSQMLIAKSRKCVNAFIVENNVVPAIAYLEWCGVHLDEEKWKAKMAKDKKELSACKEALDNYVYSNTKLNTKFVSTVTQLDIFNSDAKPDITINWNSPKSVVSVFQALGFDTKIFDKNTSSIKDTVLEKEISTQKGIDDTFLKLYYDFKGAEKNVSTYGQGHLNLVNPKTNRLHTTFHQIGTVTGRMSCGGRGAYNKDLAYYKMINPMDVKYVNLQQLPARGEDGIICRSCYMASSDKTVFLSCDYSAEESRVQADVWNEKSLLDAFEHGIDTHNLYAKMCFPEELKDVDVKDVKKVHPELRQAAKSAEFAVAYGSNGASIATSIGMSREKAMKMVQGIIEGMPGMAAFKKTTVSFLKAHGYIIINQYTGHRIYWNKWAEWKEQQSRMDESFWADYYQNHVDTEDEVCQLVQRHNALSYEWFNKNVLNYPIQGGSAIVLKQALSDLFRWIVKNGYFGKILFCVVVHDEICAECPKELSEMFTTILQDTMKNASAKYYKKLPIPAECSVGDHWIH